MKEEERHASNYQRRYSRLTSIPEIGPKGIEALQESHVMIVGCGALGSLCAMYLAASGVGKLTIADFDTIDLSNLQRQLFFTEDDLGCSKAMTLADRIHNINAETKINMVEKMIREDDAMELFADCDVVVDGSDNPDTKVMTDMISWRMNVPCVIAGVRGFECQIITSLPDSARYTDIFGTSPGSNGFTPCSVMGVLGPAAGVAASLQAAEVIKRITGAGNPLIDRLCTFNLFDMTSSTIPI